MTPKEILEKARALITDPKHWTRGKFARDTCGSSVSVDSSTATCFCTVGAVYRVSASVTVGHHEALDLLANELDQLGRPSRSIPTFNDSSTHEQVLALFDRAIASCP